MTRPTFSIRGLLGITSLVAVACAALATPSVYWVVPIPFAFCVLTVCAAHRLTQSIGLKVLAGIAAYLIIHAFADTVFSNLTSAFRLGWAFQVYKMLHDDSSNDTIASFIVIIQVTVAVVVSSLTTAILRGRD
jgi:hypothetical protein